MGRLGVGELGEGRPGWEVLGEGRPGVGELGEGGLGLAMTWVMMKGREMSPMILVPGPGRLGQWQTREGAGEGEGGAKGGWGEELG